MLKYAEHVHNETTFEFFRSSHLVYAVISSPAEYRESTHKKFKGNDVCTKKQLFNLDFSVTDIQSFLIKTK